MAKGLPIGTKVRVKNVAAEDAVVAEHILPYVGRVGLVKTVPDVSGSQWVEFADGAGSIFYPE